MLPFVEDTADSAALIGRTIAGKFHIESLVGEGAMGAVYRARQLALDKTVAVKVMHPHLQRDPQFAGRFNREARAASRLDHPNSVRVVDFGQEPDGLLYIAMEFVDGKDLLTVLREDWPLPAKRVASIVSQILAALSVAHEMGVVHRDLKPENLIVLRGTDDEGRPTDIVKVCDFGMAKVDKRGDPQRTESARLSTRGLVLGTPEYMSPEQGRGEALDARSDIYSVGVILYQLLTGTVPFEASSAIAVVLKHVTEAPVPPSSRVPGVDPRLEAVCLRALQKKPEARYQTAREMRAEVRAVESAGDVVAPSIHGTGAVSAPRSFAQAVTVAYGSSGPASTPAPESEPLVVPKSGPSVLLVAVISLLVGGLGVGAWYGMRRAPGPVATASAPPQLPPAPPAEPSAIAPAPSTTAPPVASSARLRASPPNPGGAPKAPKAGASAEVVDPAKAHVDVVSVQITGPVNPAEVRAAVSALATPCYKEAMRAPNAEARAFRQELSLDTDENGAVRRFSMQIPAFAKGMQTCFLEALLGKKIGTGAGNVKVTLSFQPR
jgi:serine/threonine-protein kinase